MTGRSIECDEASGSAGTRRFTRRKARRWALCFAVYLATYLLFSRIGMMNSADLGVTGFYFAEPTSLHGVLFHYACCVAYYPLIAIESLADPAKTPLWNMPMYELSQLSPSRDR